MKRLIRPFPAFSSPLFYLLGISSLAGCFSPPEDPSSDREPSSPGSSSTDGTTGSVDDPSASNTAEPDRTDTTGDPLSESSSTSGGAESGGAVCGDSVVQAEEECDDGEESSSCNADCTFAMCGDGVVNTTAGEACDAGPQADEESGCDDSCALVVLTRSFRQGQAGYGSARDTWIEENAPGVPHSNHDSLHCVGVNYQEQVLLRFEQMIGEGEGQIPPGASVVSAHLTLSSNGEEYAGSVAVNSLHEMLVDWDTGDTYSSPVFGGDGVQLGVEAVSDAIGQTNGAITDEGFYEFDVTPSLQRWVSGEPNRGWFVWQPSGLDRWFIASSEHPQIQRRPRLVVEFTVQ